MRKKSLIISENTSSELTYSNKENTTNYKETVKRVLRMINDYQS